jgi:hypothetical protein
MSIQEIIFKIISSSNGQMWVRYWNIKSHSGMSSPGEYVELRGSFISNTYLMELFEAGFEIETIKVQKINADAYSDVLLKRKLQ